MIYIVALSGVFFLHLLLKLNMVVTILLSVFVIAMIPFHRKRYETYTKYKQRFQESALYIDTLLYMHLQKKGKPIEHCLMQNRLCPMER